MTTYDGALILSGEGEVGTWERHTGKGTLTAIRRRLNRERCNGDRWASVWVPAGEGYEDDAYMEINEDTGEPTGDYRTVTEDDINE